MTRPTRKQVASWLAYCNRQLDDPTLDPDRRAVLEAKAEHLRRQLAGSCSRCGRALSDPDSLAIGIGPECLEQVRLDLADAEDRLYDRALAHELSQA